MKNRALHKIAEARDSVTLIERHLPDTYQAFASMNKLERDGIYKNVEYAIQNILDICALLVKEKGLQVPASDRDMLEELQKADILKEETVTIIQHMRGFLNYLVHRYGDIDDEVAYRDIKRGLSDFTAVLQALQKFFR